MTDDAPHEDKASPARSAPRLGADLWTRLVSAIVMAVGALALTWIGGWPFAILVMIGGCVILWEWAGITKQPQSGVGFILQCATVSSVVASVMLATTWGAQWPIWVFIVGTAMSLLVARPSDRRQMICGLIYAALPCAALVWFRNAPSFGIEAVCLLFIVVWGTDIMAYVFGRYFGGPKLLPAVSPKKTWSGALGGTTGAILGTIALAVMLPQADVLRLVAIAFFLSIVSQIGDLVESSLKRRYDVKDSSNLIPGHGGLLDRVDGLLFAVAAAALFVLVSGGADDPSRFLVVGG